MLTSFKTRQEVMFDVRNKKHREHFYTFLQTNSWAKDAPLFALEGSWLQVPDMILHKLAFYNLEKEFKK